MTEISLGQFLKQEREARGYTLEQVASQTKIAFRILQALEGDLYSELPAKPFIRGFIQSVCRCLELDASEVMQRFDRFLDVKLQERPSKEAAFSGYAFESSEHDRSRLMLWIVLGVFGVVGGAGMLIFKPKLKHHKGSEHAEELKKAHGVSVVPSPLPPTSPIPSPSVSQSLISAPSPSSSPSPSPSFTTPSVSPVASPTVSPVAAPSVLHSPTVQVTSGDAPLFNPKDPLNTGANLLSRAIKHKLLFTASEGVVVRYQTDQRPVTKIRLGKEKMLVLKAQEVIRFQISNPSLVTVSINGGPATDLSEVTSGVFKDRGDFSWVFPAEAAETIREIFPGQPDLAGAPVWVGPPSQSTPTPAP